MDNNMITVGQAYLAQVLAEEGDAEHVGVKGMRWGVRRSRKQRAAAREARAAENHDDHKLAREISKKRVSKMSNDELRVLNNRLQLEQQYMKLNPPKSVRRQKQVEAALNQLKTGQKLWNAIPDKTKTKYIDKGKEALKKIY